MIKENGLIDVSELIPGVILIRELKKVEDMANMESLGIFVYKIQLKKMYVLNLELDLSHSNNIRLNNKNSKKIKISIMPFETKIIAQIYLEKDFEINPIFNFNFLIPEKSIQMKYLKQYEEKKLNLLKRVKREISNYSFEYMDLEEINEILYNLNINFIDLDFLHNNKSLLNNNYKYSDLNYIIHWRRPQDFLINTVENEQNNIKIISYLIEMERLLSMMLSKDYFLLII